MKYNNNILAVAIACLASASVMTACYDLTDLSENPYELPNKSAGGGTVTDVEDESPYADINIDYTISAADSAECETALRNAGGTFREFVYQCYYDDYQRTTNLTHDIYGGYVANNQPKHARKAPDYNYTDGWSGLRWKFFYENRCQEYRQLVRAFKFNNNPTHYKNALYATRIYLAFAALANTDTYGDMPFREYVRARVPETNNVAYDTQEEVYDAMFRMLEQAVDSIDLADATQYSPGSDDICYFGDYSKWVRFANTLRLRMALRISNIDPARAQREAQAAMSHPAGLILSNDDNMQTVPKHAPTAIGGEDAGGSENGLSMCSVAYKGESVLSWDLEHYYRTLSTGGEEYTIKSGRNQSRTEKIDPRCLVCWYRANMTANALAAGEDSQREDFTGCHRGAQDPDITMDPIKYSITRTQPTPLSKDLNPKFWFNHARPTVWLGYAEALFLQAEAALRGWTGGDPETLFRQGVQASMDYYMIDPQVAAAYIDGIVALNDGTFTSGDRERILEAIITHKWMAVFPNGNEAWAEFRRTDYPVLENQLTNMSGGSVPEGKMIKRILYPDSESSNAWFTANSELQSANTQGTRLWWDTDDTNDAAGNRMQPNNFR